MSPRLLLLWFAGAFLLAAAQEPPESWIDPDTGHRVVRLTREPGSASLYFNQNGYTADKRRMIYTTPEGVSALDLQSHQTREIVKGNVRVIVTGRKSNTVYYIRDGAVWVSDVDSLASREIGKLPRRGSVASVNADETLVAGTYIEGEGADYNQRPQPASQPAQASQVHPLDQPVNKGQMMEERLAARLPMAMFTMNVKTGESKVIHRATD